MKPLKLIVYDICYEGPPSCRVRSLICPRCLHWLVLILVNRDNQQEERTPVGEGSWAVAGKYWTGAKGRLTQLNVLANRQFYPGVGPEHAFLKDLDAVEYVWQMWWSWGCLVLLTKRKGLAGNRKSHAALCNIASQDKSPDSRSYDLSSGPCLS